MSLEIKRLSGNEHEIRTKISTEIYISVACHKTWHSMVIFVNFFETENLVQSVTLLFFARFKLSQLKEVCHIIA